MVFNWNGITWSHLGLFEGRGLSTSRVKSTLSLTRAEKGLRQSSSTGVPLSAMLLSAVHPVTPPPDTPPSARPTASREGCVAPSQRGARTPHGAGGDGERQHGDRDELQRGVECSERQHAIHAPGGEGRHELLQQLQQLHAIREHPPHRLRSCARREPVRYGLRDTPHWGG
jgi:hypothetical protein